MTAPPADYAYDVFFSYKRHSLTLDWTRGVYRRLELWLSEELNRPAQMFVDEASIDTGDRWPEGLRQALKLSKCMACVWSPSYFQSNWCVSEWQSFRERERQLNRQSHGLIAPLRFHDGEHFPPDAQSVQWTDVAPYTSTVPAFWTSARALELEDRLKEYARSVARIVNGAPSFTADWPVVEAPPFPAGKIELARL